MAARLYEALRGKSLALSVFAGAGERERPEAPEPAEVDRADPALHRYLCARIGGAAHECLHAIWCDVHRGYLGDEELAFGSAARIETRARHLFERALAIGAGAVILAHNHPSGDCRPSTDDIDATRRLAAIARALDIELVDHFVVTRARIFSMRAAGCF